MTIIRTSQLLAEIAANLAILDDDIARKASTNILDCSMIDDCEAHEAMDEANALINQEQDWDALGWGRA